MNFTSENAAGFGQFDILPVEMKNYILDFLNTSQILQLRSTCKSFRQFLEDRIYLRVRKGDSLSEAAEIDKEKRRKFKYGFCKLDLEGVRQADDTDLRAFENLVTVRIIINGQSCWEPLFLRKGLLSRTHRLYLPRSVAKLVLLRNTCKKPITVKSPTVISLGELLYSETAYYYLHHLNSSVDSICVEINRGCTELNHSCLFLVRPATTQKIELSSRNHSEILVSVTLNWLIAKKDNAPWADDNFSFDQYMNALALFFKDNGFFQKRILRLRLMLEMYSDETAAFRNIDFLFQSLCSNTIVLAICFMGFDLAMLFGADPCATELRELCLIVTHPYCVPTTQALSSTLKSVRGLTNRNVKHITLKLIGFSLERITYNLQIALETLLPCCPCLTSIHVETTINGNGPEEFRAFELIDWPKLQLPTAFSLKLLCVENWFYAKGGQFLSRSFGNFVQQLSPERVILIRHCPVVERFILPCDPFPNLRFDVINTMESFRNTSDVEDVLSVARIVDKIEQVDMIHKVGVSYGTPDVFEFDFFRKEERNIRDPIDFSYYSTSSTKRFCIPLDGSPNGTSLRF
ncbi:hypothetical protein BC332_34611 [Capsicum chinense]|nr:hypothetical protein BC332_34611 [Capsicum chinense]